MGTLVSLRTKCGNTRTLDVSELPQTVRVPMLADITASDTVELFDLQCGLSYRTFERRGALWYVEVRTTCTRHHDGERHDENPWRRSLAKLVVAPTLEQVKAVRRKGDSRTVRMLTTLCGCSCLYEEGDGFEPPAAWHVAINALDAFGEESLYRVNDVRQFKLVGRESNVEGYRVVHYFEADNCGGVVAARSASAAHFTYKEYYRNQFMPQKAAQLKGHTP